MALTDEEMQTVLDEAASERFQWSRGTQTLAKDLQDVCASIRAEIKKRQEITPEDAEIILQYGLIDFLQDSISYRAEKEVKDRGEQLDNIYCCLDELRDVHPEVKKAVYNAISGNHSPRGDESSGREFLPERKVGLQESSEPPSVATTDTSSASEESQPVAEGQTRREAFSRGPNRRTVKPGEGYVTTAQKMGFNEVFYSNGEPICLFNPDDKKYHGIAIFSSDGQSTIVMVYQGNREKKLFKTVHEFYQEYKNYINDQKPIVWRQGDKFYYYLPPSEKIQIQGLPDNSTEVISSITPLPGGYLVLKFRTRAMGVLDATTNKFVNTGTEIKVVNSVTGGLLVSSQPLEYDCFRLTLHRRDASPKSFSYDGSVHVVADLGQNEYLFLKDDQTLVNVKIKGDKIELLAKSEFNIPYQVDGVASRFVHLPSRNRWALFNPELSDQIVFNPSEQTFKKIVVDKQPDERRYVLPTGKNIGIKCAQQQQQQKEITTMRKPL